MRPATRPSACYRSSRIRPQELIRAKGNSAALDEVVHAWRSTAAVYSDPKLAADLKRSLPGTHTKVSRP
jgi:hypothetical protein